MLLEGKKAVVTGGSRGIGRAIVLEFLKEGATVIFLDTKPSPHLQEMEETARRTGTQVAWKQADVSVEAELIEVFEEILKENQGIDILVNNAGITRDGLIFRMSTENWERVLGINLTAAFITSRIVAREMIKRKGGTIINMSSVVGMIGNPGQANYSASKAGLIGLTKSLAKEVGSRGVRVNAIAPGFIETPMTEALPEQARQAMMAQIPLGRSGRAEDVAKAVAFLASDHASYITGEVLKVAGGMAI